MLLDQDLTSAPDRCNEQPRRLQRKALNLVGEAASGTAKRHKRLPIFIPSFRLGFPSPMRGFGPKYGDLLCHLTGFVSVHPWVQVHLVKRPGVINQVRS